MEAQQVKVGDSVFASNWEGLELTATVVKVEDEEFWVEVSLAGTHAAKEWEAGEVSSNFDTFAFGAWNEGPGLPIWWGDLDGDGKPELLAPCPKGDLSPPLFRIFRWTGDDLLFLQKRMLVSDDAEEFVWAKLDDDEASSIWIESFSGDRAEVLTLGASELRRDFITVEPTLDGFRRSTGQQ